MQAWRPPPPKPIYRQQTQEVLRFHLHGNTNVISPSVLGWLWRLLSNMLVWVSHQRPVWGGT